jgi:hypothetical protein
MDLIPTDNYDDLLNEASRITGTPRKKRPPDDKVKSILERMRGGESKQESTGNTGAVNPDSGAIGEFQVMPYNVPVWTQKHYGQRLSPEQFKNNPQAQQAVFNGEMGDYVRRGLKASGGDEDTAMRMAAAAWYGGLGAMHRYDDPKPQYYKGKPYPSFREYTSKVLNKSKAGQSFDYADLLKQADAITGASSQPQTDYQDLLNQASQITQTSPSPILPPVGPGPTNPSGQVLKSPVPAIETPPPPVPEAPETLSAQAASMLDPKSPRSAVLVTPGAQLPLLANSSGLTAVKLPEGTLFVDPRKIGIRPQDVPAYVKKNGFAGLIGKVEDVGNNTSTGAALVTKDANGNELSSSVVTTPQTAQKQAQVDQAQFPQAATQTVVPAQKVVADRVNQQATPPVQQPAFDPRQFHIANAYLVSQGQKPLSKEEYLASIGNFGSDVVPSVNPSDFKIGETPVNSPELQQGETVGKGTLTMERTVGKPTDDLSGIAATYTPTNAKSDVDAYKQALVAAGSKYGITPDEVDAYVARRKGRQLWTEPSAYQQGDQIQVPLSVLQEVGGDKVRVQNRMEQAQNYNPTPDLSVHLKASLTPEDMNDALGSVGAIIGSAANNVSGGAIGDELGRDVSGFLRSLNESGGGGTAKLLKGAFRAINDLSPTKGESLGEARGAVKTVPSLVEALDDTASGSDTLARQVNNDGQMSWVFKTAGQFAGATPRFLLLSALPGGVVTAMSLEQGGQAYGQGADKQTALKELGKGAAFGALFRFAPIVGKAGNVGLATLANKAGSSAIEEGITLGTIGSGSYAVSRAFGDKPSDALANGLMNAGFHAVSQLQNKITTKEGMTVRARDESGNVLAAKIDDSGKVVTTDPNQPADIEVYVPKTAEPQVRRDETILDAVRNVGKTEKKGWTSVIDAQGKPHLIKDEQLSDLNSQLNDVQAELDSYIRPLTADERTAIEERHAGDSALSPKEFQDYLDQSRNYDLSKISEDKLRELSDRAHDLQRAVYRRTHEIFGEEIPDWLKPTNETNTPIPSQPAQVAETPSVPNAEVPAPEKVSEPVTGTKPTAESQNAAAPDLSANHEALKQAFELPLLKSKGESLYLKKRIDVTYETESGKSVTRQMKAGDRQAQIESKGKVLKKLLDCLHS